MAQKDINKSAKELANLLIDIDNNSKGIRASTGFSATDARLKTLPPNMVYVRILDTGAPIPVFHNGFVDPQKPNAAVYVKPVSGNLNPNSNEKQYEIVGVDTAENNRRFGGNASNVQGVTSPELIKVGRRRLSEARISVDPNNGWGLYLSPYQSVQGTIPPTYYEFSSGIISAITSVSNMVYTAIVGYDFNVSGKNDGDFVVIKTSTLTNGAEPNLTTLLDNLYLDGDEPTSSTIVLAAVTLRNGETKILDTDIIDLRETFNAYPTAHYDSIYIDGALGTGVVATFFNGTGTDRRLKRITTFCRTEPSSNMTINFYINGSSSVFSANAYQHTASNKSHSIPLSDNFDGGQDVDFVNPYWASGSYIEVNVTNAYSAQDVQITIEYW